MVEENVDDHLLMVRETVLLYSLFKNILKFCLYEFDPIIPLTHCFHDMSNHLVSPKYKIKRVCCDQTCQQKSNLKNKIEDFLVRMIHFD